MINKLLHIIIPFYHAWDKWIDVGSYVGYHKQKRYCKICNKVETRLEDLDYSGSK